MLFSTQTILAIIKPSLVGIAERSVTSSTPFYLGVAAQDIHQDQHRSHMPKINIFIPSEQNIFLFERKDQVDLPKEAVGLVLDAFTPPASEEIILPEEIYKVVSVFREAREPCIEGDECVTDPFVEDADFTDDGLNGVVCTDSVILSTISTSHRGRNIRPPTRLDLKFGFALLHYMIGKENLRHCSQPVRSKTKTNRDLLACVFPRLTPISYTCFKFVNGQLIAGAQSDTFFTVHTIINIFL